MRVTHQHIPQPPIEISPSMALSTLQASLEHTQALPLAEQTEQLDPLKIDQVKQRFATGDLRILARADEEMVTSLRSVRDGLADQLQAHPITAKNSHGGFETSIQQMNRALGELAGDSFGYTEGQRLPPLTMAEAKKLMETDHLGRAHMLHNISPIVGSPMETTAVHRAIEHGRCYFDSTNHQLLGHGLLVVSDELTGWVRTEPSPKIPKS